MNMYALQGIIDRWERNELLSSLTSETCDDATAVADEPGMQKCNSTRLVYNKFLFIHRTSHLHNLVLLSLS